MILQFVTGICPRIRVRSIRRPGLDQSASAKPSAGLSAGSFGALHGWGSNFMVALVLIHMVQVFLFGAYKYPRELTWMVGIFCC
jgi:ubiquinol-cytochrome c reductase cytochrome b subunit